MPEIGVRELKSKASEIIRAVREEGAEYIVTYRGAAVGVLSPLPEAPAQIVLPDLADILEPLLRRVVQEELDARAATRDESEAHAVANESEQSRADRAKAIRDFFDKWQGVLEGIDPEEAKLQYLRDKYA